MRWRGLIPSGLAGWRFALLGTGLLVGLHAAAAGAACPSVADLAPGAMGEAGGVTAWLATGDGRVTAADAVAFARLRAGVVAGEWALGAEACPPLPGDVAPGATVPGGWSPAGDGLLGADDAARLVDVILGRMVLGSAPAFRVEGRVANGAGAGVAGVDVALAGRHVTTGGDGAFSFDGVPAGRHALAAARDMLAFMPTGPFHLHEDRLGLVVTASIDSPAIVPAAAARAGCVAWPAGCAQPPPGPLTVTSAFGEIVADGSGCFTGLDVMLEEGEGQLVTLALGTGETVAVAWLPPSDVAAGDLRIDSRAMALGLAMLNPYLMVFEEPERLRFAADVATWPELASLEEQLATALCEDPQRAMVYEFHPALHEAAAALGMRWLTSVAQAAPATAGLTVGAVSDPHVEVGEGGAVSLVNPRLAFYAGDVDGTQAVLVPAVKGALRLGVLPPRLEWTEPRREDLTLADGSHVVTYSLGFGGDGWLVPTTAPGKATYANLMRIVGITINVTLKLTKSHGVVGFLNPFTDMDTIKAFVDAFEGAPLDLEDFAQYVGPRKAFALIKGAMTWLAKPANWDRIAYWTWQELPGSTTSTLLGRLKGVVGSIASALTFVDWALLGWDVANQYVPFVSDLFTGPSPVTCRFTTSGSTVTDVVTTSPPEARFTFSPRRPVVGEEVLFDAAPTTDDATAFRDLLFRWDYDGDGTWDTPWTGYDDWGDYTRHAFGREGTYDVTLAVQDAGGLVGQTSLFIAVDAPTAGGSASHVVVFGDRLPWDSGAFYDLVATLGITPGPGERQYEWHGSEDLATWPLSPVNDLVIIVNDQTQVFYDRLASSMWRFESFVAAGGTLLFEACDRGWGGGYMSTAGLEIPGGVQYSYDYDYWNWIETGSGPLVEGLDGWLYNNYASHEGFYDLPAGTVVYARDERGYPTLVEYAWGEGRILLTGQPLEHAYDRGNSLGVLYPRLLEYVLGLGQP